MIEIKNRKDLLTKYRDSNLFIEAGAGAGKTQFISDKTSDLILEGVPVDKIILITFTNKAAEEMISRISRDLNEKIKNTINPKIKEQLNDGKNNLYRLNVSTIHSFCNKLLNENSFLAKIPYNFTLIDEDEEDIRRSEYFTKYISTLSNGDFSKLNKYAFFANPLSETKNRFIKLCSYFPDQDININVPSLNEFINYLDEINELFKVLYSNKDILKPVYRSNMNKFMDEYISLLDEINTFNKNEVEEYLASPLLANKIISIIKLVGDQETLKRYSTKVDKSKYDEVNAKLEGFIPIFEASDRMITFKYKYVNEYAREAFNYYNDNCSKEKLSNNQLIYFTYKLLSDSNNSKVRDSLAKKYNSIFVDEFQDTDKYQIKFIDELVKAINTHKHERGINNTTLIVVGDPKQSIYRFRGADINSFLDYRDSNSINKEIIYLPDNYRSNEYIIDFLNKTYIDKKFHKKYDYKDMLVHSSNRVDASKLKDEDKAITGVYSYSFIKDKDEIKEITNKICVNQGINVEDDTNKEVIDSIKRDVKSHNNKFLRLVKLVKYLVDNHYKIYKANENKVLDFYDISYSDFLILTHSKSEINQYVKVFNRFNIDVEVAGKYNLTSSTLFNLIYSLFSYILDPNINNLRLVQAHLDSILNKSSTESELDLYLASLINQVKDMTPYGKLMYIVNTLFLDKFYINEFYTADIKSYNTVIHQALEHININVDGDSIHILNKLDELRETPVEQQLSLYKDSKAVRIMNMHKSKGLEGNIVIIPDSGSSVRDDDSLLVDNTYYLSVNNALGNQKERAKEEIEEERLRLEYVASSRAKSVLIFESKYSSNSKIFSSNTYNFSNTSLLPYQLKDSSLPDPESVDDYFLKVAKLPKPKQCEVISLKQYKLENYKDIITPSINSFSPSSKETREEETIKSDREINRPRNNIFGDCLHRGMELLVNNYSIDIDKLSSQVVNSFIEDIPSKEVNNYIKYLSKCIRAIKSLYDKESILKDYDSYPEYKFTTFIKDENALINGSIDLFLIKDNHIKIIDYKSDISGFKDAESFKEILFNRYKSQLEFYKKVINNMFKDYIVETSIIFIEEDSDNEIAHQLII